MAPPLGRTMLSKQNNYFDICYFLFSWICRNNHWSRSLIWKLERWKFLKFPFPEWMKFTFEIPLIFRFFQKLCTHRLNSIRPRIYVRVQFYWIFMFRPSVALVILFFFISFFKIIFEKFSYFRPMFDKNSNPRQ